MNYYDLHAASHSGCKAMTADYTPPADWAPFEFGKNLDTLLDGGQVPDATDIELACAHAIRKATADLQAHPKRKRQYAFVRQLARVRWPDGIAESAWQKGLLDLWIPGVVVVDYKSTAAKTEKEFLKVCETLGYYEQMARYMMLSRTPRALIVGVSKHADVNGVHKVFKIACALDHLFMQPYIKAVHEANARWLEANYGQL